MNVHENQINYLKRREKKSEVKKYKDKTKCFTTERGRGREGEGGERIMR